MLKSVADDVVPRSRQPSTGPVALGGRACAAQTIWKPPPDGPVAVAEISGGAAKAAAHGP
jgi:hypothetical protein